MLTQRQAQVQRSPEREDRPGDRWWRGEKAFPTPTERFVDLLCELFIIQPSDEERVRLEDAFNDAVEARMVQSALEERRAARDD